MQAIDVYFEEDLVKHASYNLSEQDWEILEGLEEVLSVSYLVDPDLLQTLIAGTDPSPISATNVI